MLRRAMLLACGLASLIAVASCRRSLEVPEATYRETVTAFYTALAAMQTSQDLLARREFEHVTELVPNEPAGWANLGLLLLRQHELDAATAKLAKAAELAPESAAVQRLLALLAGTRGDLPEAIRHWKRAIDLDPGNLRARYALALDTERQGGDDGVPEAQRVMAALLDRAENLAARLELARLAAKRGDSTGLREAMAPLPEASRSWPPQAQDQLRALQEAAASDPSKAATRVSFLKNVLLRTPEFRRALAAVSTPPNEVGEPIVTFLTLPNPEPHAAPPDDSLTFDVEELEDLAPPAPTMGVTPVWLTGEGTPVVVVRPSGVVAADFNYDYRTDLLLVGTGGTSLQRQDDGGRFTDVTRATNLPAPVLGAPAFGAWAADIDTDGDLDVVLAPVDGPSLVLRNNGDGTFAEQQPFAAISQVRGFAWGDLDGDGVPDAVLLDARGTVHAFSNLRGGVFREETLPAGIPRAVALAAAEVSGDALFDVLGVAVDGTLFRLSLAEGRHPWETQTLTRVAAPPAGMVPGSAQLLMGDLDNNGAADLVLAGPATSQVLLGSGGVAFQPLSAPLTFGARAVVDLDGDGRLEILGVDERGKPVRAKSRGAKAYRWQALRLRSATATGDQRINSFGIGGEVELRTGLHLQKRLIDAPVVHFGLGEATRAEVVRVIWPNGIIQSDFDLAADSTIAATQRLKGSCPWLFAWNGRSMSFVTDLIWRSPLGLRINAQSTADVLMTEDWVKLGGDQLVPQAGAYDLRVTAELWETLFFDQLALMVIDHPEGTEAFVDERFAVPPPKLEVVVTEPVRGLRAARDDQDRDVTDVVRARDGRHLDFAGRGAYQGVTRDHYVELELPDEAPRSAPLWLVAQGWVHPTDSSINVAMAQGTLAEPRGLSLHVADAAGTFRLVRDGLGFPSGKDKTILLDLTGVFPARGRARLRLATNLEIFWDRLGWATGRPEERLASRAVELASAELRYRGYSVTEQADPGSPERPRYVLAGTAPRWLDLEGYYTRFGDVRELLVEPDDRYVIMNAGDELRLRFSEVPAPAAGLVRDFVLVGDGWVKDGDFNTTFSRTVQPLPTHASGRYDTPPGDLEDDPVHRAHQRDFEEYHTRHVSSDLVRTALHD